jgi:UPF0755 protein
MKAIFRLLLLSAFNLAALGWWVFFTNNLNSTKNRVSINIPTGSTLADVKKILAEKGILKSPFSFDLAGQWKGYTNVKAGHYVFNKTMNNRELVNMLKSGLQTPVKLIIYNIRTKEEFASLVGRTLEIDSTELLEKLNNDDFCNAYHLNTENILSHFITDNYEFYWNTSLDTFLKKMNQSHDNFWQGSRLAKSAALGYKTSEIVTLASITEKECMREKELPTVAGVYLNRLKINMPLQADPTLVFALKDFEARRVTNYHKEYDSPYNTYMHTGLPPGPICMPRKKSIDAVLNAEGHSYLYFCANPDMSGYSVFSKTLDEQNKVAALYRKKLNEMNVH